MLKKAKHFMRDNSGGGGYIDLAVFLLVFVMAIVFALSAAGAGWHKTSAQDIASYAARQIASDGYFSGDTINDLIKVAGSGHFSIRVQTGDGYDATVPISSSETSYPTEKIQNGKSITVSVLAANNDTIGIGGVGSGSVSITGVANSVSTKFWKE